MKNVENSKKECVKNKGKGAKWLFFLYLMNRIEREINVYEESKQLLNSILRKHGFRNQVVKTCEELSELETALLKCYNKGPGEGRIEAVQEEIADVYIMLEQIRKQFMSREELDNWIDYKITREAERGKLA